MVLKIIADESHPLLNKPTRRVEKLDASTKKLIEDMKDALREQADPEGVGLSANQVGSELNLAVIRLPLGKSEEPARAWADEYMVLINPQIIKTSPEKNLEIEGCLSVPGKWGRVERAREVTVQAQGLDAKTFQITAQNFLARILQHEIDHLNGNLFKEKVVGKILTEEELEEAKS